MRASHGVRTGNRRGPPAFAPVMWFGSAGLPIVAHLPSEAHRVEHSNAVGLTRVTFEVDCPRRWALQPVVNVNIKKPPFGVANGDEQGPPIPELRNLVCFPSNRRSDPYGTLNESRPGVRTTCAQRHNHQNL